MSSRTFQFGKESLAVTENNSEEDIMSKSFFSAFFCFVIVFCFSMNAMAQDPIGPDNDPLTSQTPSVSILGQEFSAPSVTTEAEIVDVFTKAAPPRMAVKPKPPKKAKRPKRTRRTRRKAVQPKPLPAVRENEIRCLDASLGESWRDSWENMFKRILTLLSKSSDLACIIIESVEDVWGYQERKASIHKCLTPEQETCRAKMLDERTIRTSSELERLSDEMGFGFSRNRFKRGKSHQMAPRGNRGVILRIKENCLPPPAEPAEHALHCWDLNANGTCDSNEDTWPVGAPDGECDAKDCRIPGRDGRDGRDGHDGSRLFMDAGIHISYSQIAGLFYSGLLRANWKVCKGLLLSLGGQFGANNGNPSLGAELGFELPTHPNISPRLALFAEAFELDNKLEFRCGSIGGRAGITGETFWSWLQYEFGMEVKWLGQSPEPAFERIFGMYLNLFYRFGNEQQVPKEDSRRQS